MDRALRRHYAERKKKRVLVYWVVWDEKDQRLVGMRARTPKPCSCPMCGHRRYWEGPTVQERRAEVVD